MDRQWWQFFLVAQNTPKTRKKWTCYLTPSSLVLPLFPHFPWQKTKKTRKRSPEKKKEKRKPSLYRRNRKTKCGNEWAADDDDKKVQVPRKKVGQRPKPKGSKMGKINKSDFIPSKISTLDSKFPPFVLEITLRFIFFLFWKEKGKKSVFHYYSFLLPILLSRPPYPKIELWSSQQRENFFSCTKVARLYMGPGDRQFLSVKKDEFVANFQKR